MVKFGVDYQTCIKEAEKLIQKEELDRASAILEKLKTDYPEDGRILFDRGNIALLQEKYSIANEYFSEACKHDYANCSVYYNLGITKEKTEDYSAAEAFYLQAAEASEDKRKQKFIKAVFAFYMRMNEIIKAKRIAYRFLDSYPDLYDGHHMMVVASLQAGEADEIQNYLKKQEKFFSNEPLYWIDYLLILESAGKYSEILHLTDTNKKMMETVPEQALREKLKCLVLRKNYEKSRKLIFDIYEQFPEKDIALSSVIVSMMDGDYIKAGNIANAILDKEKAAPGALFYAALYLDITAIYLGFNKQLNPEVLEFSIQGLESCKNWFDAHQVKTETMKYMIDMFKNMRTEQVGQKDNLSASMPDKF